MPHLRACCTVIGHVKAPSEGTAAINRIVQSLLHTLKCAWLIPWARGAMSEGGASQFQVASKTCTGQFYHSVRLSQAGSRSDADLTSDKQKLQCHLQGLLRRHQPRAAVATLQHRCRGREPRVFRMRACDSIGGAGRGDASSKARGHL